jgi:class 3 adenylate cyclase
MGRRHTIRPTESGNKPHAYLVTNPGSAGPREVAIYDRLFVGRECSGVEEHRRLLIDDPGASRNHLEIRIEPDHGVAYVVDTSTNGTRLNGIRLERAVPVMLGPGDILTVGGLRLEFRSESISKRGTLSPRLTTGGVTNGDFVMVVGDIVDFTTSSHGTPSRLVMQSLEVLLREFRALLADHRGTLSNFVGDAFFAIWELGSDTEAARHALDFVIAADARVNEIAPTLAMRSVDGEPLRMGWGLSQGDAAVSSLTGVLLGVVGDATNLAFRLSGIAGRQGRGEVLVTDNLYRELDRDLTRRYLFEELEYVNVKGMPDAAAVRGLRLPPVPGSQSA